MVNIKQKKAFTLVEILIVVSILGILAAVAIPTLQGNIEKAKTSLAKDTLRYLRLRTQLYKFHHNDTPLGYDDGVEVIPIKLAMQLTNCTDVNGNVSPSKVPMGNYVCGPYVTKLPENPFNELKTFTVLSDSQEFSAVADGTSSGWLYKPSTGEIRLNGTDTDDDGLKQYDF